MKNRTLVYLTALVLLSMIALFALNMNSLLTETPEGQTYIKLNDMRGSAVNYQQKLYTLNFKQQNSVADILNRAVRLVEIPAGESKKPLIDQMVLYTFNKEKEIQIIPVTYLNKNLIFSAPQWDPHNNFMELSEGDLENLLSQTYDP